MFTFMISIAVKSVILALLALFVVYLLRRFAARQVSAAGRHTVCVAACIGVLLLPLFSVSLPSWNILPGALIPAASKELAEVPVLKTTQQGLELVGAADPTVSTVLPATPVKTIPEPITLKPSPETAVLCAYVVGALLFLLRLGTGHFLIWRLVSRSRVVELPEAVYSLGLPSLPALRESSKVRVPMTIGVGRHAVIVLPENTAQDWPTERLNAALLHEAAHIKRGDYLVQVLADVVTSLYFFNPFVWLLSATLQDEAERAADDAALITGGIAPADYAMHLLAVVRELRHPAPALAAVTMARHNGTAARITALLASRGARNERLSHLTATVLFVLTAGITLSLALIQNVKGEENEKTAFVSESISGQAAPPVYKQTFSDGSNVEAISVTENPSWKAATPRWWAPNGAQYKGEPYSFNEKEHYNLSGPEGFVKRELYIVSRGKPGQESYFGWEGESDRILGVYKFPVFPAPQENHQDLTFSVITGAFEPTKKQATLRVGVSGPLQKIVGSIPIAAADNHYSSRWRGLNNRVIDIKVPVVKTQWTGAKELRKPRLIVTLKASEPLTPDYRFEAITIVKGSAGKPVRSIRSDTRSYGTKTALVFNGIRAEQVSAIRVIHQPLEWVRLGPISLYPETEGKLNPVSPSSSWEFRMAPPKRIADIPVDSRPGKNFVYYWKDQQGKLVRLTFQKLQQTTNASSINSGQEGREKVLHSIPRFSLKLETSEPFGREYRFQAIAIDKSKPGRPMKTIIQPSLTEVGSITTVSGATRTRTTLIFISESVKDIKTVQIIYHPLRTFADH